MQDFRRLKVWQRAHGLTLLAYAETKHFPPEERFGLRAQLRSAAVSTSANIAESCGRSSNAERVRFLHIAMGSACEMEYELLLSRDLALLGHSVHGRLNTEIIAVKRMLAALIARLRHPTPHASARQARADEGTTHS